DVWPCRTSRPRNYGRAASERPSPRRAASTSSSPCEATPIPTESPARSREPHLGQRRGVAQTTIGYCHEVSHRENRALVKLLGLELRKIKSVREVGGVDFIALRDAHEVDPELPDGNDYEVLTIVDHHRPASPPKARFVDLRMDVGATSTIFVEYLMELAALDPDLEEARRIAPAL